MHKHKGMKYFSDEPTDTIFNVLSRLLVNYNASLHPLNIERD